jgi:hypothetical protein
VKAKEMILICYSPSNRIVRNVGIGRTDNKIQVVEKIAKSLVLRYSEGLVCLHNPSHKFALEHRLVELLLELITKLEIYIWRLGACQGEHLVDSPFP